MNFFLINPTSVTIKEWPENLLIYISCSQLKAQTPESQSSGRELVPVMEWIFSESGLVAHWPAILENLSVVMALCGTSVWQHLLSNIFPSSCYWSLCMDEPRTVSQSLDWVTCQCHTCNRCLFQSKLQSVAHRLYSERAFKKDLIIILIFFLY